MGLKEDLIAFLQGHHDDDAQAPTEVVGTVAQMGFQEAAKAAVAQAPPDAEAEAPGAPDVNYPPGSVVTYEGGHALVLGVVTHVHDNVQATDGIVRPSPDLTPLPKARYLLGLFANEVGPVELDE